jgi:hypothetical protein
MGEILVDGQKKITLNRGVPKFTEQLEEHEKNYVSFRIPSVSTLLFFSIEMLIPK